ncbi:MAG: TadE/TadG family type IV pilus assembly protein [Terracidiphilus sp.]|jgi:Flp pilus assembly protein TadG
MRRVKHVFQKGDGSSAESGGRRRNRIRSEAGGAALEFALTLPILLTLVFGFIEICMACYVHEMISEVARESTRYASVHGSTCLTGSGSTCTATSSSVNAYALATGWPNIGGGTVVPNTTYPGGGVSACTAGSQAPGCPVQVQVTYIFRLSIPFIPATNLNLSSSSEMYIVQ